MSAVMMILTKRTHNPRTGKGRSSEENLVLTAAAALRVTNETAAATIANVTDRKRDDRKTR